MTTTEIKEAAKQLVLSFGPAQVMEMGSELVRDPDLAPEDIPLIVDEAQFQAERVYSFLGYDSPWKV